jgi:SAM-dependent methyltransferase
VNSLIDRHEVEKLLVLVAGIRSGLVDAVARASGPGHPGMTPEEAASALEGDARACRVMLAALAGLEIMEEADGRYRLTELGRSHLVDPPPGEGSSPDLERSSLLHMARKVEGWLDLPAVIATGRPSERSRSERDVRAFVRTMGEGDPGVMEEVADRVLEYAGLSAGATMLDVGGAVGHMARLFADRGLQATLFDRLEVLPQAREFLGSDADRLIMTAGDFTTDLPTGPFDLVYAGNVFHIYGPDVDAELARRIFSVVAPGGTIAIRDFVWERSPRAAMFAVNMLQATAEGGVWRERDYVGWLDGAGFIDVLVVDLERSQNQLVLGRRPSAGT